MDDNKETPVIIKEGTKFIIYDIPKKYIKNGSKLIIRLKENVLDYEYLHWEMLNIENDTHTLDVIDFGYYECEIFDYDNKLVFWEHEAILGFISLNIDVKTQDGVIRQYIELQESEFKENTMILLNKMEKTYFEIPELKDRIEELFDEITRGAKDFVYIQDPYFNYDFYEKLIKNLPRNLDVKVLYNPKRNEEELHLPSPCTFTLIKDKGQNGKIHDRFIITKDFGYNIGISLNRMHENKSFIHKIYNTTNVKEFFNC